MTTPAVAADKPAGPLGFLTPGRLAALAIWGLAWLLLLHFTRQSPPGDNAEQLTWVRALAWGYHKHPPLPTALLWPLVQVFGLRLWLPDLLGATTTLTALVLAHQLVARLCGTHRAALAMLGTLCVGFYTHRLSFFNHDVVLMPCVALAATCCWQALAHRSRRAWWGLGMAMGFGLLAKYQAALMAVPVLVCWAHARGWRDAQHRRGLLIAVLLALVIVSPNLLWLVTHDFLPLRYVAGNSLMATPSLERSANSVSNWAGGVLTQLVGPLLLGAGLYWRAGPSDHATPRAVALKAGADVRLFLFAWGLLPLLLIAGLGLLLRARLHLNWAMAYLPLSCATLMLAVEAARWQRVRLREAVWGFALIQLVLAAYIVATSNAGTLVYDDKRLRNFAAGAVTAAVGPPARAALGGPIRVIAGRQRLVGGIALMLDEQPLVLLDGRLDISPWVPADLPQACGVLWMGRTGDEPPPGVQVHPIGNNLWWGVSPPAGPAGRCR